GLEGARVLALASAPRDLLAADSLLVPELLHALQARAALGIDGPGIADGEQGGRRHPALLHLAQQAFAILDHVPGVQHRRLLRLGGAPMRPAAGRYRRSGDDSTG